MKLYIKSLLIAVCVVVFSFVQVRGAELERHNVKGWTVASYSDDKTKLFSHCAMVSSYSTETALLFSVDKAENWSMALANPQWKLDIGRKYNFNVFLDAASGKDWFGYAITPTMIKIPLRSDPATLGSFQTSKVLTVVAPNGKFSFSLTNSSEAFVGLTGCAHKHVAQTTNPFESDKKPVTSSGPDDLYAEAAITSTNLLSSLGANYRLIPVDKVKANFPSEHAVWVAKDAVGSLRIDLSDVSMDTMATKLIDIAAMQCKGKFATGKEEAENGSYRIEVMCKQPNNDVVSYSVILRSRKPQGFYIFRVTGIKGTLSRESASKMNDTILSYQQN